MRFALASPLKIPEGKSGEWAVTHEIHEAGTCLDIVNMRKAVTTGAMPVRVQLAERRVVHKLLHEGGVVMSDLPVEMADHMEFYGKARGSVLVGGLGLGYIATKLLQNRRVKRIEVVEKERDVIKLIQPIINRIIRQAQTEQAQDEFRSGVSTRYWRSANLKTF
jgi:hypothetical protein